MTTRILPEQIQNLQQLEVVVGGPDGANRMLTIHGQFDVSVSAIGTANNVSQATNTYRLLVGPVLTRQQFYRAIGIASLSKTQVNINIVPAICNISINDFDADWDDETGQVELKIDISASTFSQNNSTSINGIAFQATILYAAS